MGIFYYTVLRMLFIVNVINVSPIVKLMQNNNNFRSRRVHYASVLTIT